jgi:hypothetical protein
MQIILDEVAGGRPGVSYRTQKNFARYADPSWFVPIRAQLARIGMRAGKPFSFKELSVTAG